MTTLKVLTLNVWGLHWQSLRIHERLGYIAEELKNYDLVGLQEVWKPEDYAFLVERLEKTLPYSHHMRRFHVSISFVLTLFTMILFPDWAIDYCQGNGVVGNGLCVFSRFPIVAIFTHQFSVSGGVHELADGEMLAGKGIMGCRIQTPEGQIAFFNTHTNPRCRNSQIFEILQFVECTRGSDTVILLGDFNTKPRHLAYSLLTKCMGMHDVFEEDPVDTCDLVSNIYTKKWMTPKRIDFIFYCDEFSANHNITLKAHRLAVTGIIPGKDFPYTDHEGVEATFLLEERDAPVKVPQRIYDDTAVQVFQEVADCIHATKVGYETTENKVLATWAVLFVISLLVALLLGNYSVFNTLADYHLHWLCTLVPCLVGAGSIAWVAVTLSSGQLGNAMEANLADIRAILRYNSSLRKTVTNSTDD